MYILIIGKNGQLAHELANSIPAGVTARFLSSTELDISNQAAVNTLIAKERPDAIINAAAYTAVDRAETEQQQAYAVNAKGPQYLAEACRRMGAHLVQVSTDFVFDGTSNTPYTPDSITNPISVYGSSKLAGEQAVQQALPAATIIRTSWVYSSHGNNFVKTMLRLMTEKDQLGVVADQIGAPTWAAGLAQVCWQAAQQQPAGMYHWSDAGVASWYDFAIAVQSIALSKGLLKKYIPVLPIKTVDYPTPARRPTFSLLDSDKTKELLKLKSIHWREQLTLMLEEMVNENV